MSVSCVYLLLNWSKENLITHHEEIVTVWSQCAFHCGLCFLLLWCPLWVLWENTIQANRRLLKPAECDFVPGLVGLGDCSPAGSEMTHYCEPVQIFGWEVKPLWVSNYIQHFQQGLLYIQIFWDTQIWLKQILSDKICQVNSETGARKWDCKEAHRQASS